MQYPVKKFFELFWKIGDLGWIFSETAKQTMKIPKIKIQISNKFQITRLK